MKLTRERIMPGVMLTCIKTDKFKTSCLSLSLMTALDGDKASKNAIIPKVLLRGSTASPDMREIAARLDELYGARLVPAVRKKGEVQCVGFFADFPDERYVPYDSGLLKQTATLLGEVLLSPITRGGLLLPEYVDSEREKLLDEIRAHINDKRSYSVHRLVELMCEGEAFAVDRLGSEREAEAINYQKLTRYYREFLAKSPIEVFYCGGADRSEVVSAVLVALGSLPRGEIDGDVGTNIRLGAVDSAPRYFTEEMEVTQGKLALGFRLGKCMKNPDAAAIMVMNAVYGGSVTSKLFMNVREKLSLCYYASSSTERHKGLMLVSSGVEFDKYDEALGEILKQLEAVKNGDISDYELSAAKNYIASSLKSVMDSPSALEEYWLGRAIDGEQYAPDELAQLALEVTKEKVSETAGGIETDAVYFLRGPKA